jgi:hypothetical protein
MMKKTQKDVIKHTGLKENTARFQSKSGVTNSSSSPENKITFLCPVDGDMLNEYDGVASFGCLRINVKLSASLNRTLMINGILADYNDGIYQADINLKDYENVIEITDMLSGEKQSIIVFWLKNIVNKYRLSLDDNIWFLKDIYSNTGKYKSIFENPYLNFLKQVHDFYGTKIHLNLFYQSEGFNLSQMTDKFKNEWKENAGWLRLSFHSLQEFPDRPYAHAGYNEVKKECKMVMEQIGRFAGEELLSPVMSLHWGDTTVECCRALKDEGYKAFAGYFNFDDPDPFSYYLDIEKRRHVNTRFIWRDNTEGIIFSKMALVVNMLKSEQILPYLDSLRCESHKPAYVDFMIHEQYFYPFYNGYQPDFRQKVLTSVKWASDNGYEPAFLSECIFE